MSRFVHWFVTLLLAAALVSTSWSLSVAGRNYAAAADENQQLRQSNLKLAQQNSRLGYQLTCATNPHAGVCDGPGF